jgi:hypothetical protein
MQSILTGIRLFSLSIITCRHFLRHPTSGQMNIDVDGEEGICMVSLLTNRFSNNQNKKGAAQ